MKRLIPFIIPILLISCGEKRNQSIMTSVSKIDRDSLYIFKRLIFINEQTGEFEDLEEPLIYEYWTDNQDSAVMYFGKAIKIESIPFDQRLILAQYLFKNSQDKKTINDILDKLSNYQDTVTAYRIIDSYGLNFSDFRVTKEILSKYCTDCEFR